MVGLAMASPPDDVLHHQVTRSYRQPAAFRGGRRASAFVASVAVAGGGSAVDVGTITAMAVNVFVPWTHGLPVGRSAVSGEGGRLPAGKGS